MRHPVRSRDDVIDLTQPITLTPTAGLIPQISAETWYEFEYRESTQIASAFIYVLPFAFLIDILFVYLVWQALHLL